MKLALKRAVLCGFISISGCAEMMGPSPESGNPTTPVVPPVTAQDRIRSRPPVNPNRNLYEGSVWQGASSWGNLMRDHRARYAGDLLTVTEMNKIIKVTEVKPEEIRPDQKQPAQGEKAPAEDPILRFLREQEKLREAMDKEQNEILRSIEMVEVEVVRVLPNGNLLVRGVHPPIFRDRNRVKYIISLGGVVRPSDVDDNNNILATKLHQAEYKVRRLVRDKGVPLGGIARAIDRPSEGALLDRLTDFLTTPEGVRPSQGRVPR